MHPLLCSLQNVIYWGTSAAFLPDSLPYLIALPVPVSPHMYVYIIIYIYIFCPGLGFVFAQVLAFPVHCVCDHAGRGNCLELKGCVGSLNLFVSILPFGAKFMPLHMLDNHTP